MARLLHLEPDDVGDDMPFLELGSDSVIVMEAVRVLEQSYRVKLSARQVFEQLNTVNTLAEYVYENERAVRGTEEPAPHTPSAPSPASKHSLRAELSPDALERIFAQQLQMAAEATRRVVAEQLAFLQTEEAVSQSLPPAHQGLTAQAAAPETTVRLDPATRKPLSVTRTRSAFSLAQQEHLDRLTREFTSKTPTSKAAVQEHRRVLADSRASVGFRPSFKEMLYPLVIKRSSGARAWDIDGNEYVDFMMGFGVSLFGHWPEFIQERVRPRLGDSAALGLRSPLAGEAARLFTELTGHERVVFAATGTEAVMGAIRMARAATGRTRLVVFEGAYHGHADGTAVALLGAKEHRAVAPIAPGIPGSVTENVLVLEYNSPHSLQRIREHAHELAAVLVEPVQSRRPELQPAEFLRELRALTAELDVPLVFDEMITGFRLHPQGAQGFFGVRADLAVYGKILGGGLPIGAVAGKARYLDGVDGGLWGYGDASYPQAERVFFGGTFFQHPLSMAAALAVLERIKEQGPALQARLNERTAGFVQRINALFAAEDVPMKAVHCGSLFRFQFTGNLEIFFYHLLNKGVLIGEWRSCFLCTEHTDADLDRALAAIAQTIAEMRAGGFLEARPSDRHTRERAALSQPQPSLPAAERHVPTTQAQRQLWRLHNIDSQSSLAYHERVLARLTGTLDLSALRTALQRVVDRHESLRSTFDPDGQTQHVRVAAQLALSVHPLAEPDVPAWLAEEGQRPFDFAAGPLFRASVLRLGPQAHLLVLTAHHIITDGTSLDLILHELATLYSAQLTGRDAVLAPALQFSDYVKWQAEQLQREALQAQSRYWLGQLAGPLPAAELPLDSAHPRAKSYRGARTTCTLASTLVGALTRLARQEQCTVFMTCLAAYLAFLHRLSGQADLIVGVPTSGRGLEGGATLVGYCTHLLPIRSRLDGRPTFTEFLHKIKGLLLEAYDHSDYPYAELLNRLAVPRAANRAPLIGSVFNLDKPRETPPMAGLAVEFLPAPKEFSHFDLALNLTTYSDRWVLEWSYNTDVLRPETMARWAEHFVELLTGIVANPESRLLRLPLLSAEQRSRLLALCDHVGVGEPRAAPMHVLFAEQVQRSPDSLAVVMDGGTEQEGHAATDALSYRALDERANRLAHHLRSLGVGPDKLVGVCVQRSLDMIVGLLAVLKAGGAFLPIDPTYPRDRVAFMIDDSGVALLLTQEVLVERLPAARPGLVLFEDAAWQAQGHAEPLECLVTGAHLAYSIYTSGSTGRPKAALIEHRGLSNLVLDQIARFGVRAGDRCMQLASLSFDAAVYELAIALCAGATLVLGQRESLLPGPELVSLLKRQRVTMLTISPAALAALPEAALPELRTLVCAGEALPRPLMERWHDPTGHRTVYNAYGPTEATICATIGACDTGEGAVPIGTPLRGVAVYVLDPEQQLQPIGVAGEIYIGGLGVARGYLNRPELTGQRFLSDPIAARPSARLYRTGDLGRLLPDGSLEFLGRIDQQVKIRGFRIELGEIESVLAAHPAVGACAVTARQDEGHEKRLVAYVVLKLGSNVEVSALRAHLGGRLPEHMLPAAFVFLSALPQTPNGKVDRAALPAPQATRPELSVAWSEPLSAPEQTLARIFAEVLRIERVGRNDDFFTLGGDSISALQVVARAAERGLSLRIKQMFLTPTVAGLAAGTLPRTEQRRAHDAAPGPVPLTPIQRWFFEISSAAPHHFNQAAVLEVDVGPQPALLAQAIAAVHAHHDAFRLRFTASDGGWQQSLSANHTPIELVQVDLSTCTTEAEQHARLDAHATELQSGMDLARGPLVRAALFTRGGGQKPWLFLAAHHLVVDAVSWRILLEDLDTACAQLAAGGSVQLPPVPTPFCAWARALRQHAGSAEVRAQLAYWRETVTADTGRIGTDARGPNLIGSARTHTITLDAALTRQLLREAPAAYGANTQDLLLAALSSVFAQRLSAPVLRIDLESHGRDPDAMYGLDLSRTIGWFTALYPLLLDLNARSDAERICTIKEHVRRVPASGISYGVLRYLMEEPEVAQSLRGAAPAELCFNYLGQMDGGVKEEAALRWLAVDSGQTASPLIERQHALEVNALCLAGQLQIHLTYSENLHRAETVAALASALEVELNRIAAHCLEPGAGGYTPSDFPLCGMNRAALNHVLDSLGIKGRGDIEDVYPQTPMQEGMLFHTLLSPERPVYYTQLTLHLAGSVDAARMAAAWQHVVDQQPVLRTSFMMPEEGRPLQVVHKQAAVSFAALDLRETAPEQQAARLDRLRQELRAAGFRMHQPPLLRVNLVRLGQAEWCLILGAHHAILDGWSLSLLVREVAGAYEALCEGQRPSARAGRSLRDYVAWLGRQALRAAESYWRQALHGFVAPTPLPFARAQATTDARREPKGAVARQLGPEQTGHLQALCRSQQVTLSSLFQSAWAVLLGRLTGEADVVFGLTVSGRTPEIEEMEQRIGLFINTVPVRAAVPADAEYIEWSRGLQAKLLEARQHEWTPLAQCQAWSEVPRGQPLFESILIFDNYPAETAPSECRDWKVRRIDAHELTNFPLLVSVSTGDRIELQIEYDGGRLGDRDAARLLDCYVRLLAGIVQNPRARLWELPLLDATERQTILYGWNQTRTDYLQELCVHELFELQAERTPEATAVVCEGQSLSYRTLNEHANRLAHRLRGSGVGPDTLVGLCVGRCPALIVGVLGVLKAGGAYVPIDPAYPPERIAFLLQDAQVEALVTTERLRALLPSGPRAICVDLAQPGPESSTANPQVAVKPDNLAYCIYTSGSSGKPKGTLIEHRGLMNYLAWAGRAYEADRGEGTPINTSISFDATVTSLFLPLLHGKKVFLLPEADEMEALRDLLESGTELSLVKLTPAHLDVLRGLVTRPTAARYFVVGGEALTAGHLAFWKRHAPDTRVVNEYGPTETVVGCCTYEVPMSEELPASVPIGRPIANTRLYVLDAHRQPVPALVAGELYIGGDGVARAYHARPELTAERFVRSPFDEGRLFKTGDRCRYLPDGTLEFLGRLDSQVKIRGFRIEPGEIESVLKQHPSVRDSAILPREGPTGQKRLVAYVVPRGELADASALGQQLRAFLQDKLPVYMVPSAFVALDVLPLTPHGKVDLRALPAPEPLAAPDHYRAPQTETEQAIARLWSAVLGIERVGRHDNFFELGGDSILSIQVTSRARQAGLTITPRNIFQAPTVAQLAQLAQLTLPTRALATEAGPVLGEIALAPVQRWFFDRHATDPQQYNQSTCYEVPANLDLRILRQAVRHLVDHHDALRARYYRGPAGWTQAFQPAAETTVHRHDLTAIPTEQRMACLYETACRLQSSLDLEAGPLMQLAWFDRGAEQNGLLVWVLHHLIVDGVSWRILVEDLNTLYGQLRAGDQPVLPAKTCSYRAWTEWLHGLARSTELQSQASYWKGLGALPFAPLPSDRARTAGANVVSSERKFTCTLSREQTQALLREVPAAYRTQIDDLLLSALALAFTRWTGQIRLWLEFEGHGRQTELSANSDQLELDLSRTVGWFTCIYPVVVEVSARELGQIIKDVKEQRRRVPDQGLGYGVLRYLGEDAALASLPRPEVLFTYLGQFDSGASRVPAESAAAPDRLLLAEVSADLGPERSPRQERTHTLEIGCWVAGEQFHSSFTYSANLHEAATIQRLVDSFAATLNELIDHCRSPDAGGFTPSDFALAGLDQAALDDVLDELGELDDL